MKFLKLISLVLFLANCSKKETSQAIRSAEPVKGTFAYDAAFLKQHKAVVTLGGSGNARVLVMPDYQGRVMTSTAGGDSGNSYGWINYALIASGKIQPHIHPVGGEDRFWLGPEGGQFALYFKKGDPFEFSVWQTPAVIDSEPFDLVNADSTQATFHRFTSITNYQGTAFDLDIQRQVRLLDAGSIAGILGVHDSTLKTVGFQTINIITNKGKGAWTEKSGIPSIWILGMFNPSPTTTIVVPFRKASGSDGAITDDYFGKIPADRLVRSDSFLLFKGDGASRGKLGIAPGIARDVAGSYDAQKNVLTIVKFDLDPKGKYVNSKWEIQKEPFKGDAVNSYNDGPLADGGQLGPFYEIESSSPARALKPGEYCRHSHTTIHVEGPPASLNAIALHVLGVSLETIQGAFQEKK